MENTKENIDAKNKAIADFKQNANSLMDQLNSFKPAMDGMEIMAEKEISDDERKLVKQLKTDAKGLDIEGLKRLKNEYLEKIQNGI